VGFWPEYEEKALRQATQRLEGVSGLSADNSNSTTAQGEPKVKKAPGRRKGAGPDEVGKALRSAYDETLRENVPDDFLDLLGKLS
jgi:hypothetical protein